MNSLNVNAISANSQSSPGLTNRSAGNGTNNGSEQDMFMTLLVAQLKNQDPLQPQDGTAFVAQLAQFNSLNQLIGIRESIEQLLALSHQPTDTNTSQESLLPQIQSS